MVALLYLDMSTQWFHEWFETFDNNVYSGDYTFMLIFSIALLCVVNIINVYTDYQFLLHLLAAREHLINND